MKAQFGPVLLLHHVGEDRFSWLIVGDEGSLRIPDSGTVVVRQRYEDDRPVELEIARADKVVLSTDLIQHTWNRLIEDFIGAVRTTTTITTALDCRSPYAGPLAAPCRRGPYR
jgi:hypothetical protein